MTSIKGKSVSDRIAMGPAAVFDNRPGENMSIEKSEDTAWELSILEKSLGESVRELELLYDKTLKEVGEEEAMIFKVHMKLLEDEEYLGDIKRLILEDNYKAYSAVSETAHKYACIFTKMDDEYMSARAADIKDISLRVISHITGYVKTFNPDGPSILFAYDLSPSETISMDKSNILAIVTQKGSVNSHTAILAKTMGVPAIVCADFELSDIENGSTVIVDGRKSLVYITPDKTTESEYTTLLKKQHHEEESMAEMVGKITETKSGKIINLYTNIGSIEDVSLALNNDAEGVGLFRSEFLYVGKDKAPTEEEQFEAYSYVLKKMENKPVIIRTLDIGADKKADYLNIGPEENPALGLRAIRLCLISKDLFKTQFRALLRASCFGNLHIMYPMITSLEELSRISVVMDEVKAELDSEGIEYKTPKQGIMIETPAAALISDELAKHVDFFSIGSNDLTQYTLAMDRQGGVLDSFFDPHHPAVLKLIRMTIDNAHKNNIWAGICGELAADTELTETFLEMGVDELSVSPSAILKLRKKILSLA